MTQNPKIAGVGQLASSKGTLYTVPASTAALPGKLLLYNTGSALETVIIYTKKSGGSSRVAARLQLAANETGTVDFEHCGLATGDEVEGVTTTATTVDYTLFALEVS